MMIYINSSESGGRLEALRHHRIPDHRPAVGLRRHVGHQFLGRSRSLRRGHPSHRQPRASDRAVRAQEGSEQGHQLGQTPGPDAGGGSPTMPDTHPAIASAYNQLAERWTDARFNPQDGLAQHRRALAFLGEPRPGGWALNVGCGCNTRFNTLLRAHGLALEGVDLSARMLALARAADPGVVLHQADVVAWQPARRYRFIAGWDSLWHVPLDQQRAVLLKLLLALEPGGVFLFTAGGLDGPGEHWDATMGPSVYYATLGIPGLLAVLRSALH